MNSNDPIEEQWRREQEIRAAQPWPVFKRRAYRVLQIVFLWLALGLFFQVVGLEEDGSVNQDFERWFLFVVMAASCWALGTFSGVRDPETLRRDREELALSFIGTLMLGMLATMVIFLSGWMGAKVWSLFV